MDPLRRLLETDAAFGVGEIPRAALLRPRAQLATSVNLPTAHLQYVADAVAQAGADPMAARTKKSVVELPGPPAGNMPELPPINREQKMVRMAELKKEADELFAPFLGDIATRIVFGEGDVDAPILFVGEGPGIEEDRTGRPFVGRSGQLLDKMITAMGFVRAQLYIANIVKLRCAESSEEWGGKLKDRPPTPEEAARALPILHRQIEIIRPRVIVTLGAPAIKYLTGEKEGVMKIRGTWKNYRGIPVMPTYHPSFILRAYTPENRAKVWSDLQQVMEKVKI